MNIIYNLIITLYGFGISLAAGFNQKAKKWVGGRRKWKKNLKIKISPEDKIIWMHCSSLGEFEQGRPVLEKIKGEFPNHKIALSFFSPSGYEVQKDYEVADYIFYLPLDTQKNVSSLIKILHPELLILVKYEYWYNLLKKLKREKIPVIVISAVVKEKNLFFRPYADYFRKIISSIQQFFVQDGDSKGLLNAIGIDQVTISGDTRFDRVKEIEFSQPKLDFMEKFVASNYRLIIAGSTWSDDEEILIKFCNNQLPGNWKVAIAPHNIKSQEIHKMVQQFNLKSCLYSTATDEELRTSQVLVVDAIGLLSKIYAYADISYVGGGFTKTGVHNTLEPAVFGSPVIFGPRYENYFEAKELIQCGGAQRFKDQFDFDEKMMSLMTDEKERKKRGTAAANYIKSKPNSTEVILNYLKKIIQN